MRMTKLKQGVVAAGGQLTAEAGVAMLKQGGNAVDAAIAAAFMSFFAEIAMVHWGGSGIAQLYDPANGESIVYDFFSNMPGLGHDGPPDKLDFGPVEIHFTATSQQFHLGRASVAVPGNLFGLCQLSAEKGTLPLATLLQPVIDAATNGIAINTYQAKTCRLLEPLYTHTASMRRIFAPDGTMLHAGDRLYIPDLPQLLKELADAGAALLRTGRLGRSLCEDQSLQGGLISQADLDAYSVSTHAPLRIGHHGYELLLPRPCSIGGLLIGFTFRLLTSCKPRQYAVGSAESNQLIFEAMQATARARQRLETSSRGGDIADHIDQFLSDTFVGQYVNEVQQAMRNKRPFAPAPSHPSHPNTSHISVIDGNGMAVTLTTTAGESAGYVVPGTGFIPNNMLGEADLNPHGWHQWQPGKRLPTMMAPTILLKDGKVVMATGSGGSERIRSALVQVISNVVDHGMVAADAVAHPRVHAENNVMQCEFGYDPAAIDTLESWGYAVNRWQQPSMYFGGAHSVVVDADGLIQGAADHRRDGFVAHL